MTVVKRVNVRRGVDGVLAGVGPGMPIGVSNAEGMRVICAATAEGREWLMGCDDEGRIYVWMASGMPVAVAEAGCEVMCAVESGRNEVVVMTGQGRVFLDYSPATGWTSRGKATRLPQVTIEAEAAEKLSGMAAGLSLGSVDLREGLTDKMVRQIGNAVVPVVNSLLNSARRRGMTVNPVTARWLLEDRAGNVIAGGVETTAGGLQEDIKITTTIDSTGRTGAMEVSIVPTALRATVEAKNGANGNWAEYIGNVRIETSGQEEWRVSREEMEWRIEHPASGEATLTLIFRRPTTTNAGRMALTEVTLIEPDATEERTARVWPARKPKWLSQDDETMTRKLIQRLNERGFTARHATKHGDTIVWSGIRPSDGGDEMRGLVGTSRAGKGLTLTDAQDCGEPGTAALVSAQRRGGSWGFGCGHVYGLTRDGILGISVSGAKRALSISKLSNAGLYGTAMNCAATKDGVAFATSGGREIAIAEGTICRRIATREKERISSLGYDAVHNELTAWYESGTRETFELNHINGMEPESHINTNMPEATGIVSTGAMMAVSAKDGSLTDQAEERADLNGTAAIEAETRGERGAKGVIAEMSAAYCAGSIEIGTCGGDDSAYSPAAIYNISGEVRSGFRLNTPLPPRQKIKVKIEMTECRNLRIDKIWIY